MSRKLGFPKIGLKLWSINNESFSKARQLYESGEIDFIELYYVPGSLDKIDLERLSGMRISIHAPHFGSGFNFASHIIDDDVISQLRLLCNRIPYEYLVFHPGIKSADSDLHSLEKNIAKLGLQGFCIENVPRFLPYVNAETLVYKPSDFLVLLKATKAGMCLDFSHAICAANSDGKDPWRYIRDFMALGPKVFHLTDGDFFSTKDIHMSLKDGNFPIKELLRMVPGDSYLVLETPKNSMVELDEDIRNLNLLKRLLSELS